MGLPDDAATLLFTSGSTATPKAVVHPLAAHRASALASNAVVPFGPGDRWLLSLPLCHVGGLALLFRSWCGGGAVALPAPKQLLSDAVRELAPTHVSLVATQLSRLLDADGGVLESCREVLIGGGPVSRTLVERARARGLVLRQTYGMTEMASQICTAQRGTADSCGAPVPGAQVALGTDGEVRVGGAMLCSGLVEDGRWRDVRERDGLYPTRDVGVWAEPGSDGQRNLRIVGRKDNQFVCGGENVQPEAVEALLLDADLDGVASPEAIIVVDVPDPAWGARPVAFVRGSTRTTAALASRARDLLAPAMRPIAWLPLDDEQSAMLKPSRAALRARAQATLKENT
jgi:O-succinylbenzoic acid--CoA ligase